MYGIDNINDQKNNRMYTVHFKVIVPIVSYYKDKNLIKFSDVNLENGIYENPGKEIKISINGIQNNRLLSDINFNRILSINDYILKAELTSDNYISLIIK